MSERAEAIDRAVAAYRELAELAESIEDEWQYVNDLVEAYEPSMEALRQGEPLTAAAAAGVDEAIAEIGLVSDPHKAIDWLSTFPHLIGLAVGGNVDASLSFVPAADERDEPDKDSPFAALLRRNP